MARKRPKKPKPKPPSPKRSPTGNPKRRTASPRTPEEGKALVQNDLRTTIIAYLRTRKYPEVAFQRQNIEMVIGVSAHSALDDFIKDSVNNYEKLQYPNTPIKNFDTEFGEALKPKIKRKSEFQDVSRPEVENSSGGMGTGENSTGTGKPKKGGK